MLLNGVGWAVRPCVGLISAAVLKNVSNVLHSLYRDRGCLSIVHILYDYKKKNTEGKPAFVQISYLIFPESVVLATWINRRVIVFPICFYYVVPDRISPMTSLRKVAAPLRSRPPGEGALYHQPDSTTSLLRFHMTGELPVRSHQPPPLFSAG